MKIQSQKIRIMVGLIFVSFLMVNTGCIQQFLQPKKQSKTAPAIKRPSSLYYDFSDVLIPKELKIEETFVYRAGGYVSGVMILKGRVELSSIVNFFANNMAKDNWKLLSTFKSPRTLMLFQKENRWCVINITEGKYSFPSKVEIWVAPTQNSSVEINTGGSFTESLIN